MSGQKSHLKDYEKLKWKSFPMIERLSTFETIDRWAGLELFQKNVGKCSDLWEAKTKSTNPDMLFSEPPFYDVLSFTRKLPWVHHAGPKAVLARQHDSVSPCLWLPTALPRTTICLCTQASLCFWIGLGCHWMVPLSFIIFICLAFSKVRIYVLILLSNFG